MTASAAKKSAARKGKVGSGKADLEKVPFKALHPFSFFILNIKFVHSSTLSPKR